MTQDPIGITGGTNLYAYVGNSPVNYIDPLGLGNLLVGVGGSAVVPVGITGGAEMSVGIAVHAENNLLMLFGLGGALLDVAMQQDECKKRMDNVGVFGSIGVPDVGFNISTDLFMGYVTGEIEEVAGTTANLNIVGGPISFTLLKNQQGNIIGFTAGAGPGIPLGVSSAISNTGVITVGEVVDFWTR